MLVDLAVNPPPDFPASATAAGPTLAPEELADHKLLALFDRAAARDFADVYVLARRFGKDLLLARAAQIHAGFDPMVLADMLATLDRLTDSEIQCPTARRLLTCALLLGLGIGTGRVSPGTALVRAGVGQRCRPARCGSSQRMSLGSQGQVLWKS